MKNNINFFFIILIIFFAQLLNANDLFESPFKKIEFQTNNIEDTKNYHISELKLFNNENSIINADTFDSIEGLTHKLLTNKYSLTDIIRYSEMEETIIGLNLLENSIFFLRKEYYTDILMIIYDNYVNSDIMETYMISNHLWELRGYVIMLSIYSLTYYINRYRINRDNEFIYNRYISKNMVKYKYMKNDSLSDRIFYLIDTYQMTKDQKYKDELFKIDSKKINCHITIYESLYNIKSLYQLS